ncbi:MAG: precorrin-3B C(17)-methyltransferase, partial [Cyanobacteria bacterium P01_H01_bin.121]
TAAAIAGLASLDLKADEPGLLALSEVKQWPLQCFTSAELNTIAVPNPSAVVAQAVGTASVAEAAALLAATRHCDRWASLQTAAKPSLIAPKQVYRLDTEPGAVTVAIAQAPLEYLPTAGHVDLIGTGPGAIHQITPAAQAAIARADVVLGYSLYLDLIQPLLHGEQIIEHWAITAEQARAERALDLAEWGLRVALVSSGDCGIYGMAGLALECLTQRGWAGGRPTVQVHPGISAVQAAAAQVGAPLMHDFCTISLSDLLTPWPTIERRLVAAAQADFVVALYNPKSKNRSHQIEQAQQILLTYRNPETPVALVRSVYRLEQQIILTTLENFLHHPIDMVTVVLIGNQSTRQHGQWLITPRGYLGFTDNAKH